MSESPTKEKRERRDYSGLTEKVAANHTLAELVDKFDAPSEQARANAISVAPVVR